MKPLISLGNKILKGQILWFDHKLHIVCLALGVIELNKSQSLVSGNIKAISLNPEISNLEFSIYRTAYRVQISHTEFNIQENYMERS